MKFGAVIAGGGKGERLGSEVPKCLRKIENVPMIMLSCWAFEQVEEIESIVLVVPPGSEDDVRAEITGAGLTKVTAVVPGGEQRQDSVQAGLRALQDDLDHILIHDGARPLVSIDLIEKTIIALKGKQAVVVATSVTDTLHQSHDNHTAKGPDRDTLVAVQTPQGFNRMMLDRVFAIVKTRGMTATDEVTMVRDTMGINSEIVEGESVNVKITHPQDLGIYASQLKERVRMMEKTETDAYVTPRSLSWGVRIGEGYDVHRLTTGRDLILGGVKIPYSKGLLGHSDADVLTHAICDALLGAASMGDIGAHFPDDSYIFKDISSLKLLAQVCTILEGAGYRPVNVDSTLVMELPKVAEHVYAMRRNIAKNLKLDVLNVSVKATTTEGLGFTGTGEGIAARAVVLIGKI